MARRLLLVFVLLGVLLVVACTGPADVEPELVEAAPTVTVQSQVPNAEETQLIQLDNCDGKADLTRTEERAQSIEAEISAEVAAQIGASAQVVYGNVQTAVGAALKSGNARGTAIQLVAPPGSRMEYQLIWIGDEEVGVVQNILNSDVPIAFRSFSASDVRIKSQYDLGCSASPLHTDDIEQAEGTSSLAPTESAPVGIGCDQLIVGDPHPPSLGSGWAFAASNEDRIIHVWSNHWDPNLSEFKFFLPAGNTITFMSGGGSFWSDRPGCTGVARVLYERDGFREITFEQYQRYVEQGAIP